MLTENAGAFLGLGASLPDAARRAIFVGAMAAILAGALAWLLLAAGKLPPVRSLAAGLMLGGGIANFVDRLPDGLVTDYAVVALGPLRTGVFNLPDMAIMAGALLWIAGGFRRGYSGDVSKGGL